MSFKGKYVSIRLLPEVLYKRRQFKNRYNEMIQDRKLFNLKTKITKDYTYYP